MEQQQQQPPQLVPPSLRFGNMQTEEPRRMSSSASAPPPQPQDSEEFAATTNNLPLPTSNSVNTNNNTGDETVESPIDLGSKAVPSRPAPTIPHSHENGEQQHYSNSRRVDPTAGSENNITTTTKTDDGDVNEDTDDHGVDVTRMNKSHRLKTSTGNNNDESTTAPHQNENNANNKNQQYEEETEEDEESMNEELWIRRSWLRDFALDNFACALCRRLASDPVVVGDRDDELVCRRCYTNELAATSNAKVRDAPSFITRAVQQLRSSFSTALTLEEAAEEERKRNEPKLDVNLALRIDEEEANRRSNISIAFHESISELFRKHQIRLRSRMPGTSRQLKCEGDQKYEAQDYNGANELYSRAIDVNDGTQKIGGMYANRSAALFMLMRFKECIADCNKAVEIDATAGPKMWARCQKAALQLGDLKSSLKFWELINKHNNGKASEEQLAERQRLASGAERLEKITSSTPQSEVQDTYKLLMTRFPEVLHFRCMYCESMMNAERYDEVINKLSQGYARTPKASYLLAKAYYMSGFEEFPRAKTTIVEFAEADAECRALKEKIFAVDDHKQKGNDLFSRKHFADSIVCYSSAIELASTNGRVLRVLYCNRAAAYKEVGKFKEGVEDCTKAISFDAKFVKAFARRARCLLGVQDFQAAVSDFKKACELEPSDPELARELRYAQRLADDELAKEKDLYHVLGVSKTATASEIKSRFRELSLKYHPDKCMGLPDVQRVEAERKFKIINEAYQTLSNQESRNKYDLADAAKNRKPYGAGGMGGAGANPYAYRPSYGGANPSDMFRNAANPNNRYAYGNHHHGQGGPSSFF